jgi:trans-2,3-dihydro-3-hydroxyanthranilic acid synthase
MAIAPIQAYRMPQASELPANVVDWRLDHRRSVLLVHDMQRYFAAPFPQEQSPYTDLVANIVALRNRSAALGVPVVYTAQPGSMTPAQRGLLADFWGPGMSGEPEQQALVDELEQADGVVVTKWRYSAFHASGLLDRFRSMDRDQVIICGVFAHLGCLLTASDAFSHDIQPFFAADAVADFSRAQHDLALAHAAGSCARVSVTADLLAQLGDSGQAR